MSETRTDLYTGVHAMCERLHKETWRRNVECTACDLNDGMADCQMHYEECPAVKRELFKLKAHIDCLDL